MFPVITETPQKLSNISVSAVAAKLKLEFQRKRMFYNLFEREFNADSF